MVKLWFTSIGFFLTQKTCYIRCSWLVVLIPWRSLSKRRKVSEINRKAYKSSFVLLTSRRSKILKKKCLFRCLFYLFVKFDDLFLPATLTRTRDLYPHPHPRLLPAIRDPRHLDIVLNKQLFSSSRNRFLRRTSTSQDRFALRQLLWPDFST